MIQGCKFCGRSAGRLGLGHIRVSTAPVSRTVICQIKQGWMPDHRFLVADTKPRQKDMRSSAQQIRRASGCRGATNAVWLLARGKGRFISLMTSALLRQRMRAFLLVGVSLSLSGAGSKFKGCRTNANLVSLQASLSLQLLVKYRGRRGSLVQKISGLLCSVKAVQSYSPRFHPFSQHREAARP